MLSLEEQWTKGAKIWPKFRNAHRYLCGTFKVPKYGDMSMPSDQVGMKHNPYRLPSTSFRLISAPLVQSNNLRLARAEQTRAVSVFGQKAPPTVSRLKAVPLHP